MAYGWRVHRIRTMPEDQETAEINELLLPLCENWSLWFPIEQQNND